MYYIVVRQNVSFSYPPQNSSSVFKITKILNSKLIFGKQEVLFRRFKMLPFSYSKYVLNKLWFISKFSINIWKAFCF